MKQISIISASGGVGKTSIALAIAKFLQKVVLVDCDIENAELSLLLKPQSINSYTKKANQKVSITEDECIRCGLCKALCHFDAIDNQEGIYEVEKIKCQACNLCLKACPVGAIAHITGIQNQWFDAKIQNGSLVFAKLAQGENLSGRLISQIRERAVDIATETKSDYIIIDGPPMIGYALASAIAGIDLAIIVVEPSQGAKQQIQDIVNVANRYEVPYTCLINKSDISTEISDSIKQFCIENSIPRVAEVPFIEDIEIDKLTPHLQSIILG